MQMLGINIHIVLHVTHTNSAASANADINAQCKQPIYTKWKHLCFSVYFNVESACTHHLCQWVTQTQTLGVNGLQ